MKDNMFASFAAVPATKKSGGGGGGGGGWMTARRTGRDDAAISKAKTNAAEARKAKNRRGGTAKKASGGGRGGAKGGGKRKKKQDDWSDDSEPEFDDYSEEEEDEDGWIARSDEDEDLDVDLESEGEEDHWDSAMEDDDSDVGKKKKTTKKKGGKKLSRADRARERNNAKAAWKAPAKQEEDDIEESPVPPPRGLGGKRSVKKVDMTMGSDSDSSGGLMDDIYASATKSKKAAKSAQSPINLESDATDDVSPLPPKSKKPRMSPHFSEEKKEEDEEEFLNGARKGNAAGKGKKRQIKDDSDTDDDLFGEATASNDNQAAGDWLDSDLDDTPRKSMGHAGPSFNSEDYVDEDEAIAIATAMKESMNDQKKGNKRLKKGGKRRKKGESSSLEEIKPASPAKEAPKYKDDVEPLQDSDDDAHEDDEVEAYEVVDEEEQTAAQVLAEANALSAKIIQIVSGWCGGLDKGDKVKGMILGENEGALSLGNGGAGGEKDETWITNDTMKEIMPNVTLAEYQLLGVNWMALLNRSTFGKGKKGAGMNVNGILADEMGLGKTVQTIAFLAWLNHQNKEDAKAKRRPHLIVVPASVLSNWMNEFAKFAPEMKVEKYYGNQAERIEIREDFEYKYVRGKEPLDAVLTTFSYFSSDSNKGDRSFLRKFEFDYLVVDEGHTLKNAKGLRYQNLNKFKTSHRLLLTGTPVQNSPKELMSLLCFLMPLFDSKRKRGYDDDDDEDAGGERMLEYFVHLEGGTGADADAKAYRKLKQLFAPFVLRRKKDDVLGQLLPPKTRTVEIVPMDEPMRSAYDAIISNHVKARTKKGSGATSASDTKHLFTTLRKAANHPLLLRSRFKSEEEKKDLAIRALNYGWFGNDPSCTLQLVRDELDKFSDYQIHCAAIQMIDENPARREYLQKYTLMEEDLFCSPKFVRLRTLLPELIGKGHRLLIFSQWTSTLDLMQHLLHSLQMEFLRLDGSTAVSERQDLLDTFTSDPSIPVFLLSTRAGGMGLNLTAASVCILHDLDFNPFNDRQAEDRCHRIGQKKPVQIIKMVTQGTVDEDIYSIQERKARMNEAIMEEGGGKKRPKKSNDNDEMCRLANAAVERFLKSPVRPKAEPTTSVGEDASSRDSAETTTSATSSASDAPEDTKSGGATKAEVAAQKSSKPISLDCSSDESEDFETIRKNIARKSKSEN